LPCVIGIIDLAFGVLIVELMHGLCENALLEVCTLPVRVISIL